MDHLNLIEGSDLELLHLHALGHLILHELMVFVHKALVCVGYILL